LGTREKRHQTAACPDPGSGRGELSAEATTSHRGLGLGGEESGSSPVFFFASLEAAQGAFHHTSTFEEAVLWAVNLGDDTDTTGAICGQLAGAFWGEEGIPISLRSGLARFDMIESALSAILDPNAA
jgi:ADP-ribosylglycohydrolase